MSSVYLAPWDLATTGERTAFRPRSWDQAQNWSALDLRPDSTSVDGWCLLATPVDLPTTPKGVQQLASSLDERFSSAIRTKLGNALSLVVNEVDLRTLIKRLLYLEGKEDGTKWRGVQPYRRGDTDVFEVWLGGELLDRTIVPVIQGGADYTNDFIRADGTSIGNPTTLTEVAGVWDTVSNRASITSAGGAISRYARDGTNNTASSNQYAQCKVYGTLTAFASGGVCLRFAAAANTNYNIIIDQSNVMQLWKAVAGAETQLDSNAATYVAGQLVRAEINGSSISQYYNGSLIHTITDTAIASGTLCGIVGYNTTASQITIDSLAFGDLVTTTALSGKGSSASAGIASLRIAAALTGTGASATVGRAGVNAFLVIAGKGTAATAGAATLAATMALSGKGSNASASTATLQLLAYLSGKGSNANTGKAGLLSALALSGSGSNSFTGRGGMLLLASFSGAGALASAARAAIQLQLAFSGHGDNAFTGNAQLIVVTNPTTTTAAVYLFLGKRRAIGVHQRGLRVNSITD